MSEQNQLKNLIVWSDIEVLDLDRAIAFYAAVLAIQVGKESFGEQSFGILQHTEGNGGCLILGTPSAVGTLVYFNVEGRIRDAAAQVTAKGGQILQPVHPIGPHGFRAVVLDSEGNRMALHSMQDA